MSKVWRVRRCAYPVEASFAKEGGSMTKNRFKGVRDDGDYLTWWDGNCLVSVRKDSDFAKAAPPTSAEPEKQIEEGGPVA